MNRASSQGRRCGYEPLESGSMSGVTVSEDGIVTGNTYDKYGSTNPVVRRLMASFERELDELFELAAPNSVLDVGCGEGVLVHQWAQRLGERRVVGIDLEEESIQAGWAEHQAPNLEYRVMEAARSRCWSTCPIRSTRSARWLAARSITCSCPSPTSRCGGC
jgi:hypothetical protein